MFNNKLKNEIKEIKRDIDRLFDLHSALTAYLQVKFVDCTLPHMNRFKYISAKDEDK